MRNLVTCPLGEHSSAMPDSMPVAEGDIPRVFFRQGQRQEYSFGDHCVLRGSGRPLPESTSDEDALSRIPRAMGHAAAQTARKAFDEAACNRIRYEAVYAVPANMIFPPPPEEATGGTASAMRLGMAYAVALLGGVQLWFWLARWAG